VDLKAIRAKLMLSQSEFAQRYAFPIRTLQDWELGRSQPPIQVRAYLTVIERESAAVDRALGGAPELGKRSLVGRARYNIAIRA